MNSRPLVAAGLAFGLLAGCASHDPNTAERLPKPQEWSVSLPEPVETTTTTSPQPIHVGTFTVRLIRAFDTTPPDDTDPILRDYHEEQLQNTPPAVEKLSTISTLGKLNIHFNPTETVFLPYSVSDKLCNIVSEDLDLDEEPSEEEKQIWRIAVNKVNDDIVKAADSAHPGETADTTVIYYQNIDRCYPSALITSTGQISVVGGDAGPGPDPVEIQNMTPEVVFHELGHKMGLGHANTIDCGSLAQPVQDKEPCSIVEYADTTSTMGNKDYLNFDMLNGYQLARLGVLDASQIIDVSASGIFDLDSLIQPGNGPKLLRFKASGRKLTKYDEPQEYYYVELSGTEEVKQCDPNGAGEKIKTQPDCMLNQQVSLKVMRAGDYAHTTSPVPETLLVKLRPENNKYIYAEQGQDKSSTTPIFTSGDGISVSLLDIKSGKKATGQAKVAIVFPGS